MRPERPRLVSVVIPALNVEHSIAVQLDALSNQTYDGDWEMIVVDNGCTDDTVVVARSFASRLPSLRIVDARERESLNYARNVGARAARGDFLAFCDGDDAATPGWLAAIVKAGAGADIVGGALEVEDINGLRELAWHPGSRQDRLLDRGVGFLPYAPGGNCGIWTSVAREIGWDERFTLGGADYQFCWQAQLAGHTIAFAPGAVVLRRYRSRIWDLAHQHFRYGYSHPLLYKIFRDQGFNPRRSRSEVAGDLRWIAANAVGAIRDSGLRGRWVRKSALLGGRLAGSLRARTLVL